MSNISFEADPLSWKVTRVLLLLQIAGMAIVVGLCFLNFYFLALTISLLTLFVLIAVVLWLYSRYRELPLVREKRELQRLLHKFQRGLQSEVDTIHATVRQREVLFQAEKAEIHQALQTLQRDHMESGLAAAQLREATIPGVGPKLKERLAEFGVANAAQVTEKISQFPGFGEAKSQSLIDWRRSILASLEETQPQSLPHEQLEPIKQRYQALQEKNDIAESRARASKQLLEHELASFQPRIQQLAPLTFLNYLGKSLASHGMAAALLALLLIVTQVVSSVSAAASTLSSRIAAIPSATATVADTPTATLTRTSTATFTPLPTSTPTAAFTPTTARTSTLTATPPATFTLLPTVQATDTPYIPISGAEGSTNCDASYPGVCIPPAPPDLDCGDVSYRNFQVLPPDPHNFDRDADGLGCES